MQLAVRSASSAAVAPAEASSPPPRLGVPPLPLRVACHLAAEIPLVILALLQMARGWRPLSDNASIAWRSWDVFSLHSPLVGSYTVPGGGLVAHTLGPVENWILAIPVHLDPGQGALWGGTVACVAAVAVALEAAWAAGGMLGSGLASCAVGIIVMTRPDAVLALPWNPTFGLFFFMAALGAAWATACGRLSWWPMLVATGSVAAQSHEVFALAALALVVCSPLLGRWRRIPPGTLLDRHWLAVGGATAILLWAAPLFQELTGSPGNLSALWRSAHGRTAAIGLPNALGALGAAVRPFPEWLHIPNRGPALIRFFDTLATFKGPGPWAVVVLIALALIAASARRRPGDRLAALAAVALVADLATVVTVGATPTASLAKFFYLDVVWWPLGIMTWLVLGADAARLGRWLVRRLRPSTPLPGAPVAAVCATVVALALGSAALATNVALIGSEMNQYGGWSTVTSSQAAARVVAERVSHRPFLLKVTGGPGGYATFGFESGTAYALHAQGYNPRFTGGTATMNFGAWTVARPGLTVVTIHLLAHHTTEFTVSVRRPAPRG